MTKKTMSRRSTNLFIQNVSTSQICLMLATSISLNCQTPVFAQGVARPGAHNIQTTSSGMNLDLSSASKSVQAPASIPSGSVQIHSGGSTISVTPNTWLTPAQNLAVWQVLNTGAQTVRIGPTGAAIGGTVIFNSSFNSDISSLVIPKGVTTIDSSSNLNVSGVFANSGSLQFSPTSSLSSLSALNIINNPTGVISSIAALSLNAANNFVNHGSIMGTGNTSISAGNTILNSSGALISSGANLTLSAANSIVNQGIISSAANLTFLTNTLTNSSAPGTTHGASISAGNNLNLNALNIINSASMTATIGNINISSLQASNILFNNTNGVLSALQGDINVRDSLFNGKNNVNLIGGNIYSNNLNIWSGCGDINVNVNKITSTLNASAANIHVLAKTDNLQLGSITYTDDPTFYNTAGNISINSAITGSAAGTGLAIVASGDVTSTLNSSIIDTDNSGAGQNVIIIAGANMSGPAVQNSTVGPDSSTLLTITGASRTGGSISFTGTKGSISTAGSSGVGGSLTMAAWAGTGSKANSTVGDGSITVAGSINTSAGSSSTTNGNVTIISGAKKDPTGSTAINIGSIQTDTNKAQSGEVLLITGTPSITGGVFQIFNGSVIGPNSELNSASLGTSSVNPGASITVGSVSTNVAPITIVAGGKVELDGSITTNGVSSGSLVTATNSAPPPTLTATKLPTGPGGIVSIFAGGDIKGSITTISTAGLTGDGTNTASNAGGDVILAAGVNTIPTVTHVFQGSSPTSIQANSDTVDVKLSITGASSTGGNVNLASLTSIDTQAGATQLLTPTLNKATGGNVTVAAFAGANSPQTTGQVLLPAATITTQGSALNTASFTGDIQSSFDSVNNLYTYTITNVSDTSNMTTGQIVSGPFLPAAATINTIDTMTQTVVLNENAAGEAISTPVSGLTLTLGATQSVTDNYSGNVTIIAGGNIGSTNTAPTSITVNTITTNTVVSGTAQGGAEGAGNISILAASPTGALPFFIGFNSNSISSATRAGSFAPSGKPVNANISVSGPLTAAGGSFQVASTLQSFTTDITIKAGGNISVGKISNTNFSLPAGGPPAELSSSTITIEAGGILSITGAISADAGNAIANSSGNNGGTISLKAASFSFPSGQQKISADGLNGYTTLFNALNFTGDINGTSVINNMFTTVNGIGLVPGTVITDNAGGIYIPANTTISQVTLNTQAAANIPVAGQNIINMVTLDNNGNQLANGLPIAGGSIPAGATIDTSDAGYSASIVFTGNTSISSSVITNVTSDPNIPAGTPIVGPGIPVGATAGTYDSGNQQLPINVPGGGNLVGTFSGASFAAQGTIVFVTPSKNYANVASGEITAFVGNGSITLNNSTTGGTATGASFVDQLPTGQAGGNGGHISIMTTAASAINVANGSVASIPAGFAISALGGTNGGNGGVVSLVSKSSIAIDPAQLTAQPSVNNLITAGFGTLGTTGTGATFDFKAASTLFIAGSLNVNGATSTLSGNTGFPGGNGGVLNIEVNSSQAFNVGASGAPSGPTGNGVLASGVLAANGNLGTPTSANYTNVSGAFGSGGTINITNKGTGGIVLASGSLQVQAAAATDSNNLGNAQQTYIGGEGGKIFLSGQTVQSLGSLDASGGPRSAVRGSGSGGSIIIEVGSSSTPNFTVDAKNTTINGIAGNLTAAGNAVPVGSIAPPTITQGSTISTLPTGDGGTIKIKNTAGKIIINTGTQISVAASNANALLGVLGGKGGNIDLNAAGEIQCAIPLSANGGAEAVPSAIAVSSAVSSGPLVGASDVTISSLSSTTGLFPGQIVILQQKLGGLNEAVNIKSVDTKNNQIVVWQVQNDYSNPSSIQAYFRSGDGGNITITSNSSKTLSVNNGSTSGNFVNGTLQATGYNGGKIYVTNNGKGGIQVTGSQTIATTAIAPGKGLVDTTLLAAAGYGGDISLQAPLGAVLVSGTQNQVALSVDGATINESQYHANGGASPVSGGPGGNITIVSNSATAFTVNQSSGSNGITGTLSANGGAGQNGNSNAGSVTIVNLGGNVVINTGINNGFTTGQTTPLSTSGISMMPGVLLNSSNQQVIGAFGPPGNGGALTLVSAKGTVLVNGSNGINMSGNIPGQHSSNFADGLGGSISITSNSSTTFGVGVASASNGVLPASSGATLSADGWSGGSIIIKNLAGGITVASGAISVSANAANAATIAADSIHSAGGPGGSITLQAPAGALQITGTLDVSGGAQDSGNSLQGGNGGQIALQTGKGPFVIGTISGVTPQGFVGTLKADGATGGVINISAVAGADILVGGKASLSVKGYAGFVSTLDGPPVNIPGGNAGAIYLQAASAGGNVYIDGTAATGGLVAKGGDAGSTSLDTNNIGTVSGAHDGNGGKIIIITNSPTSFSVGNASANTNGLGTGGAIFDASGFNGGTIGINNLGTGGIKFNPSLLSVSAAKGAAATTNDIPGGNGGIIDLQAPAGKLGTNVKTGSTLSANATASTVTAQSGTFPIAPQTTASGGTILLSALLIDETAGSLSITARASKTTDDTGKGGTVTVVQSSTVSTALLVGNGTNLTFNVSGSPQSVSGLVKLGGTIAINSPSGLSLGDINSDSTSSTGSIILSTTGGAGTIVQTGATVKTGSLTILTGSGGLPGSGLKTAVSDLVLSSAANVTIFNTGDLTLDAAYITGAKSTLNLQTTGNLNIGNVTPPPNFAPSTAVISSVGTVKLVALGSGTNSGNINIVRNVVANNLELDSSAGNSGGKISGVGILSANKLILGPTNGDVDVKTSTGLLTINANASNSVKVSNTGNLLLSMGTSQDVGSLVINNSGTITTIGPLNQAQSVTLDNVPGTSVTAQTTAGFNVLNTSDINSLVSGKYITGLGLPSGTQVGSLYSSIVFTGDTTDGSNFLNNVPGAAQTVLAPGAVITGQGIPAGTVITLVNTAPYTVNSGTVSGVALLNNVILPSGTVLRPGTPVNSGDLPSGTVTTASPFAPFSIVGDTNNNNQLTSVPVSAKQNPGLVVGAALIGIPGAPNATITQINDLGTSLTIVFTGSANVSQMGNTVQVPSSVLVSQQATTTNSAANPSVPVFAQMSNTIPSGQGASGITITQAAYATLTNTANLSATNFTVKQLNSSVTNSDNITLTGFNNSGTNSIGAGTSTSSLTINAAGSIVQNSGTGFNVVFSANNILLSSQNGNIGHLARTFTNNIYTPSASSALNIDLIPNGSASGLLSVITTNAVNGASPGTVNLSILSSATSISSTANPNGLTNLNFLQAGGDVLISTNLGASGTLTSTNSISSAYGAITLLNNSATNGSININSSISANGGPLVIQNNNNGGTSGSSININSTASNPITLSGVGWLADGTSNAINSVGGSAGQTGVAILTGAFPSSPQAGTPPSGVISNTSPGQIFYGTNSPTNNALSLTINATGASVAFQGANTAIQLNDSTGSITINATSSALVFTSLDLKKSSVVTTLNGLPASSGIVATGLSTTGGSVTFDTNQATAQPFNLANLSTLNLAGAQTVTFANFGASNPIAVNVGSSGKNTSIAGNIQFSAQTSAGAANSFNTDAFMFFNSRVVGQVLTLPTANNGISSDFNLTVNVGGSATIAGTLTAGKPVNIAVTPVGALSLFLGGATPGVTTVTAATLPAGTLTLSGGDLIAGATGSGATAQVPGITGSITVGAANIVGTSTASMIAPTINLNVSGYNWVAPPASSATQIASGGVTGIATLAGSATMPQTSTVYTPTTLTVTAASGAVIKQASTASLNVGTLVLATANSTVQYSQTPAITLSSLGAQLVGTITEGTSVLNSANYQNLIPGTGIQGIGIPTGTRIDKLHDQLPFTGDIGAGGNVITGVTYNADLAVGATITGAGIPLDAIITNITPPDPSNNVQITFSGISTAQAGTSVSFTQAPYASLTNPATASITNGQLLNFRQPATLSTVSVTSSGATGAINTSSDLQVGSATFASQSISNLFQVSTNNLGGTIVLNSPNNSTLTINQTDGVNSGTIVANAGLSVSAAKTLIITGGALRTLGAALTITQSGTFDTTISAATLEAGTFNGTPLGPVLQPTDILAPARVTLQLGSGNLTISDASALHSIGQDIVITNQGNVDLQGSYTADGGNVKILNAGTSTKVSNSVFVANALGLTAAASKGGVVEISAGTSTSQISNLSTVPGSVPSFPLFSQTQGGPAQPLGTNIAINNNASGSSAFPTGAIMSNVSGTTGTLNVGNSPTAQTSLNVLGGGIIFNLNNASLLMNSTLVETNGLTPLASKSVVGLDIEMLAAENEAPQALANVFTRESMDAVTLTTQGFVASSGSAVKEAKAAEFAMHSGEMFLHPLAASTIHTELADIKVKKDALLALSIEDCGLRITACSGPGHISVQVGNQLINMTAGEELVISKTKLSNDEQVRTDGIGRRRLSSSKMQSNLHLSFSEVSLLSVLSSWEPLLNARSSKASTTTAVPQSRALAQSIAHRLLKTSAVLSMVTSTHGAFQAKPKQLNPARGESYLPVKFSSNSKTNLSMKN